MKRSVEGWELAGRSGVIWLVALLLCMPPLAVSAGASEDEHFQRVWERTDFLVAEGAVSRTWVWGPGPVTPPVHEPYAESPGGERVVQYFDKARMEITHPETGDPDSPWYVTNGLLVVELILGNIQVGDRDFDYFGPAALPVAGDLGDPDAPTYSTFSPMYESNLLDVGPRPLGTVIDERVNRHGVVTVDGELAEYGIIAVQLDATTNHAIAGPFWEFMTSNGPVYEAGSLVAGPLFADPILATGRPLTEAYWATVSVSGTPRDVLMQCFERRCLTYTPGNPEGFVVEAGNVGLHYRMWRYGEAG